MPDFIVSVIYCSSYPSSYYYVWNIVWFLVLSEYSSFSSTSNFKSKLNSIIFHKVAEVWLVWVLWSHHEWKHGNYGFKNIQKSTLRLVYVKIKEVIDEIIAQTSVLVPYVTGMQTEISSHLERIYLCPFITSSVKNNCSWETIYFYRSGIMLWFKMDHKVKDGKSYGYYLVQGRALMHLNRMCGHNIYKKKCDVTIVVNPPLAEENCWNGSIKLWQMVYSNK